MLWSTMRNKWIIGHKAFWKSLITIQMWGISINAFHEVIWWLYASQCLGWTVPGGEIIFLSELMVQGENEIIPLTYGGHGYFKHRSIASTTLFISLACVKSTNIISGHKITKPFSELTTELASVTFITLAACLTLTTAIVIFLLYPNLSAINFKWHFDFHVTAQN